MDVNVEKTEEVLLHKCLLHKAADSANGFAFHVDLLQVGQSSFLSFHFVRIRVGCYP